MHNKIGSRSRDDTTIFFLKALLLSFWVGVDLIAGLIAVSLAEGKISHSSGLWSMAFVVLLTGTVFSAFACLPTGGFWKRINKRGVKNLVGLKALLPVAGRPRHLLAAGVVGASLLGAAPLVYSMFSKTGDAPLKSAPNEAPSPAVVVNEAVAKKCFEVASLEQKLFRLDERAVMAECLLQYDKKYADLVTKGVAKKRSQ